MNPESYISRYRWPLGIVAFFVVLASADSFIVRAAFNNHPEVTEEQPYESGLVYQQTIDELSQAAKLGLKAEISTKPLGENRYQLRCKLKASDQALPHRVSKIALEARHGQFSKLDFTAELTPDSERVFVAEVALPQPGVWKITLLIPTGQLTARIELTQPLP